MGKTRHRVSSKYGYEDDDYEYDNQSDLKRHRQEKRLTAALKRKSYDEIMSLTEKDDWD